MDKPLDGDFYKWDNFCDWCFDNEVPETEKEKLWEVWKAGFTIGRNNPWS